MRKRTSLMKWMLQALLVSGSLQLQARQVDTAPASQALMLKPDRVFDGEKMLEKVVVVVAGNKIEFIGPESQYVGKNFQLRQLPGLTLMPGLIEGHSHILLHPYNETSWNDQVLKESESERVARATVHLRKSLEAGITTMRDLGTEGAGYADVGLKNAIEKGVIPGPRLLVAGPAIVATGSYGPKGYHENVSVPLGAQIADGHDQLIRVVREQIGKGADFIKVYADYRWGPDNTAAPTFLQEELELIVRIAESSSRYVVAHASTKEGIKRAVMAGVETIEHGDELDEELVTLMKTRGIALCPTLAAVESIASYNGWKKGQMPDTERIKQKKSSFKLAHERGVEIVFGGDVGVFPHGDNVLELELMQEYGMKAIDCLKAATSVNARLFHLQNLGKIQQGFLADLIAVPGDPTADLSSLRKPVLVMKDGEIFVQP